MQNITHLKPNSNGFLDIFQELADMGLSLWPEGERFGHHFEARPSTNNQRLAELLLIIHQNRDEVLDFLGRVAAEGTS